jgi:hypothetical protein
VGEKKKWPIVVLGGGGTLFLIRGLFGITEAARSGWAGPEVLGVCFGTGVGLFLLILAYVVYRRRFPS